jgi:hypothetical protein
MGSMLTNKGFIFDPETFDASLFDVEDMAHALENICRYGGHCGQHYSVLTHSDNCSSLVVTLGANVETALYAHIHDGSEAYLGDIPTPIKQMLPVYYEWEARIMREIQLGVGKLINENDPEAWMKNIDYGLVHKVDKAMVPYEMRALFDGEHILKLNFGNLMFLPNFKVHAKYKADYLEYFEEWVEQLKTKYRAPASV